MLVELQNDILFVLVSFTIKIYRVHQISLQKCDKEANLHGFIVLRILFYDFKYSIYMVRVL